MTVTENHPLTSEIKERCNGWVDLCIHYPTVSTRETRYKSFTAQHTANKKRGKMGFRGHTTTSIKMLITLKVPPRRHSTRILHLLPRKIMRHTCNRLPRRKRLVIHHRTLLPMRIRHHIRYNRRRRRAIKPQLWRRQVVQRFESGRLVERRGLGGHGAGRRGGRVWDEGCCVERVGRGRGGGRLGVGGGGETHHAAKQGRRSCDDDGDGGRAMGAGHADEISWLPPRSKLYLG
jgi:hypothetical protein